MEPAILDEIEERLRELPPDKLDVVLRFVSELLERSPKAGAHSEALQIMLASENVLRKDWDSPEEDEAWADL